MNKSNGEITRPTRALLKSSEQRPRIVILGGGFGGLNAARQLDGLDAEVVLIDKSNHHLFQPLLYQVATAGLSPEDIASPLRFLVRKQENTRVILQKATEIEREQKRVYLSDSYVDYDYLIVATGMRPNYFGPDRWQQNSTPLKTISDAMDLREKILWAFERAEQLDDPDKIEKWLTFVIVGAGATGVEMAGAIREIATEVMTRDFRHIDPEATRVVLIDAADQVLNAYPDDLCEHAKKELEDREVEVLLDTPVDDIRSGEVLAGERQIPTETVIWAAGVEPVPLVETLNTDFDESGRARVEETLQLRDDDYVYAVGDIAHCKDEDGEPLPGLAPVALQQGKHAALNIRAQFKDESLELFEYWDKGQMATIGRTSAVGVSQGIHFKGFVAWLAWLFIHLLYLVGFRNKVTVVLGWFYSYLTFRRGARIMLKGLPPGEKRQRDKIEEEPELTSAENRA